jgi:hypothetical protein
MKKLLIGSLTFLFVLGLTNFITRSATNRTVIAKETKYSANYSKGFEAGNVSALTSKRFHADFGTLSGVVWEKSRTLDKVTFTKDGSRMVAYYNLHSRLVGISTDADSSVIPDQTLADIRTIYKDYKIGSVIFFDSNETNATSKLVYGTRLKEENYLVELSNESKKFIIRVNVIGGKAVINQI